MFARDLFGEICNYLQNAKINTPKHNSCVARQLTRSEITANNNPHEGGFVSKTQTLIPANINEFTIITANTTGIHGYFKSIVALCNNNPNTQSPGLNTGKCSEC